MNEKYTDDKAPDPNSMSQRKRDMDALQDLGAALTTVSDSVLARCELPSRLLEAIADYQALPHKHGAQRRQLQFIGKLMRDLDDDTLARIGAELQQNVSLAKRRFQQVEQQRDALLGGSGKEVLAAYVADHPEVDVQLLNQLIRQARKEQELQKPPAAARKLFQLLREVSDSAA
jgi:ribosome-associated protein